MYLRRRNATTYWNYFGCNYNCLHFRKDAFMTPKLQKELEKIYNKFDALYQSGSIDEYKFVSLIMTDIEKNDLLKGAKFKLSFWKTKNKDDTKYSVCLGHCIRDTIQEWSKVDPKYLVKFVLFGDN